MRDNFPSAFEILHDRRFVGWNCEKFHKTLKLLKTKALDANDRNRLFGIGSRPWAICYNWIKVDKSELDGSEEIGLHPPADFVDDGTDHWKYWIEPHPCEENEYPTLRV